jgi:hypothetical protein
MAALLFLLKTCFKIDIPAFQIPLSLRRAWN